MMSSLPEFVGTVHIYLGPYRGNPIALYLRKESESSCRIAPNIYPWNRIVGEGETTNKAAANFEEKWKQGDLTPEMYSGPHWEGGIKPEKPKPPPKPAAPPKPEGTSSTPPPAESAKVEGADEKSASPPSSDPVPSPTLEPKES